MIKEAKDGARWDEACNAARNKLCEILQKKLQLTIADGRRPFYLYVDVSNEGISAVMCQEYSKKHLPVAFLSRLTRDTEKQMLEAELWLSGIRWAVKKFKWLLVHQGVTVLLPEKELLQLFKARD